MLLQGEQLCIPEDFVEGGQHRASVTLCLAGALYAVVLQTHSPPQLTYLIRKSKPMLPDFKIYCKACLLYTSDAADECVNV